MQSVNQMTKRILIGEFFEMNPRIPLLDTRTPAEFEKGHIPGAFNLPIFSNEERAKVGTTYKQLGREEAILLGFELTGNKWRGFIEKALEIAPGKKVALHCWRGGMRSGAMAWALGFYGFEVFIIEGGYKSYRHFVLDLFEQSYPIQVLGGMTGSHKTEILAEIAKQNQQTIDLEALANHMGSSFGSMGKREQPTQEQFENNLAEALRKIDKNQSLWLEDESASIGKIRLPQSLWKQMQSTDVIEVCLDNEERVNFLTKEYGVLDKNFLIEATRHIEKRLGSNHAKDAVEAINENRMSDFIRIVLVYYDKAYKRCLERRPNETIHSLNIDYKTAAEAADEIIKFAKQLKK